MNYDILSAIIMASFAYTFAQEGKRLTLQSTGGKLLLSCSSIVFMLGLVQYGIEAKLIPFLITLAPVMYLVWLRLARPKLKRR